MAFYTKTLEWKVDWSGESVGCVSRDGHPVMLSELIPESATSWAYIGVANASLFDLYRERGVKVVEEPVNWSWGYQMKFADPDSNVLWMATASRDDMPCVDEEVLES
ncbi:MAG: hypothetical protein SynsKO_33120 [Synoicihabitans sp.]